MPHKDAKTHLQNAAALVNQWHSAYMEVCLCLLTRALKCMFNKAFQQRVP